MQNQKALHMMSV